MQITSSGIETRQHPVTWEVFGRGKGILLSLFNTHGRPLKDESLRTLLAETKAILYSRGLTVDILGDVQSEQSLYPSNMLTMKSKVMLPPPGKFVKADEFSRRR